MIKQYVLKKNYNKTGSGINLKLSAGYHVNLLNYNETIGIIELSVDNLIIEIDLCGDEFGDWLEEVIKCEDCGTELPSKNFPRCDACEFKRRAEPVSAEESAYEDFTVDTLGEKLTPKDIFLAGFRSKPKLVHEDIIDYPVSYEDAKKEFLKDTNIDDHFGKNTPTSPWLIFDTISSHFWDRAEANNELRHRPKQSFDEWWKGFTYHHLLEPDARELWKSCKESHGWEE